MTRRHGWLAVCLVGLLVGRLLAVEPEQEPSPALQLWEQGQRAMLAGDADQAIDLYQQSLKHEPTLARCFLSLAAAWLEKGDDQAAAVAMERYLQLQPDHFLVRAHFAELLVRLKQLAAARDQLMQFIASIQDQQPLAEAHLVHCHRRLMEIAEAEEDEYAMHLHRGIGLYWLACQRQRLGSEGGELDTEGLLCQSAGELSLARLNRPEEARAAWYLFEVWSQLAQSQPAGRSLRAAEAAAQHSDLTPWERRNLELAWRQFGQQVGRK